MSKNTFVNEQKSEHSEVQNDKTSRQNQFNELYERLIKLTKDANEIKFNLKKFYDQVEKDILKVNKGRKKK